MAPSDHRPASLIPGGAVFPHRHLTGIEGLQPHEITFLLDEAENWVEANRRHAKPDKRLDGLTQINAFFENSTRTLLSFEIAGKRLGADVVNMHAAQSSVKKGETLIDTAQTLNAMRADVIVIRHMSSGAVRLIADKVDCPVLNAGDGRHEHPTQALLDALAIRRRRGSVAGQRVVICGDILHSRVARSNILALTALAADVRVCAPSTLMPPAMDRMFVTPFTDFDQAITDADVVMMLRVQNERMDGGYIPSSREFRLRYGLTPERLARIPDALVMHPGPMNRGVEIDSAVADGAQSAITEQVEMGVAVRMACLDVLTRRARGVEGWA
ncbi:aspartate carbamoyltransferase catalytic subunit [Sphingomonas aerophila]|jgi:aspartate carbamoyltransferase catalytic subunit|uniref:Aspartate carbamoyltransferase n=1 Tax=Sphingomonas aerophila TaxID=1344948 RepID=A0A7W9BE00_9SPHN|nr:aspartate carbamoyltransferase catalytic subunit [Sphingomonas aerophila]MBB5715485.1 aspartate carbamoyltransferase catalytic subunit [Sphingomonas aerophila]